MLSPEVLPKVFDTAPDAMLIVGSAGNVLYASQRACTLFGYAADELSTCTIEDLMPERFRQKHVHQRFRFDEEKRARPMGTGLELLARQKDGTEVPVEISLSPIRCAHETLTIATVRDITDRKQALVDLLAARQEADSARRSSLALPMAERASAGPKVLVLERDSALCEAMRLLLKTEGYCVLTAASLEDAIQLARQEAGIEVVLLQDRLPGGVTGAQAITALREVIGPGLGALLLTQHISMSLRALERDGHVQLATSLIGADALVAKLQTLRRP